MYVDFPEPVPNGGSLLSLAKIKLIPCSSDSSVEQLDFNLELHRNFTFDLLLQSLRALNKTIFKDIKLQKVIPSFFKFFWCLRKIIHDEHMIELET